MKSRGLSPRPPGFVPQNPSPRGYTVSRGKGAPARDGGDRNVGLDFDVTDRITLSTGETIPRRDATGNASRKPNAGWRAAGRAAGNGGNGPGS